jgi:large subunit ribosomal protein L10
MAITTKKQKEQFIGDLTKSIKDSKSVAFVNFHGLDVAKETSMRKALINAGVKYIVVKKTLAKRALKDSGITGDMPEFVGELAFTYGDDLTGPAREVYAFQTKYKDAVKIVGGVFEGKYMSAVEMTEIASIPSIEVLYGKFVNIINSPIQRFAIVLNQIAGTKTV